MKTTSKKKMIIETAQILNYMPNNATLFLILRKTIKIYLTHEKIFGGARDWIQDKNVQ